MMIKKRRRSKQKEFSVNSRISSFGKKVLEQELVVISNLPEVSFTSCVSIGILSIQVLTVILW